jgi:hypothetical protein
LNHEFNPVIPAQAGIQSFEDRVDSRLRGNDEQNTLTLMEG